MIRQEARILSGDIKQRTIIRNRINKPEDVMNIHTDLTISKKMKADLLKGSGEINAAYDDHEPKTTYYQQIYKGASLKYDNPRMDKDHFASTMLSVSPDPHMLSKIKLNGTKRLSLN